MASGLHVQLLETQPIVVQGQVLCLKQGPVASLELFIKRSIWSDCHLYVFLGNQILCLFCTKFGILLLSYMLSLYILYQFSSVTSNSLQPHEWQHTRPPCPSPTPAVHPNSSPSSWWWNPAISSSVIPFSSCPKSLSASESFPTSQLFTWGGQSIGVSALASFLPKNIQDRSPLEWTGWISLQSKGLSRVFSNTTVQKHQFFGAQLSSQSNSHIHTWPLEKP